MISFKSLSYAAFSVPLVVASFDLFIARLSLPCKLISAHPYVLSTAANNPAPAEPPHDFDAQKVVHQKIRNDADYDDWEYGTEPLPHESWNGEPQAAPADESKS